MEKDSNEQCVREQESSSGRLSFALHLTHRGNCCTQLQQRRPLLVLAELTLRRVSRRDDNFFIRGRIQADTLAAELLLPLAAPHDQCHTQV